jgi:hypothetical protein
MASLRNLAISLLMAGTRFFPSALPLLMTRFKILRLIGLQVEL